MWIYGENTVKDLGIHTEKSLTRKRQVNHAAAKLNQLNTILSKSTSILDKKLSGQSTMQFESHLCYTSYFDIKY